MSNHSPDGERERQREGGADSPGLTDDHLYRALTATPRRRVLYVLLVQGESTVSELAALLAGWDATNKKVMRSREDYEEIRAGLVHHHLPLLADVGLVSYDRESGAVRLEPVTPAVQALISQSIETNRR